MRKRRESPAKRRDFVEQALDLPEILHANVPHLELQGNRELSVDGCKGLLEYTEERIRLHAGSLLLTVHGASLCIQMYSESQTVLTGDIQEITMERVAAAESRDGRKNGC